MKVSHVFKGERISKVTDNDINLLLTNKKGGYFLLSDRAKSKYGGLFCTSGFTMCKTVSNIISSDEKVTEMVNEFHSVVIRRETYSERYFMPQDRNCIVYELDQEKEVILDVDVRESYSSDEWGRYYEVSAVNDIIIISFRKEGNGPFTAYLAIKSDAPEFKMLKKWIKEEYDADKARGDKPCDWHVFRAISLKVKKMCIAFSQDKDEAISEAKYVYDNYNSLLGMQEERYSKMFNPVNSEEEFAHMCAQYSLDSLLCTVDERFGIYAGLPWFFQFWSRDELISIKPFIVSDKIEVVKRILLDHMASILPDGRLPTRKPSSDLGNADSIGWLFHRFHDLLVQLEKQKKLGEFFSHEELMGVLARLDKSLHKIIDENFKEGLVQNGPLETWMDTEHGGDDRSGARIEIQALNLKMIQTAIKVATLVGLKDTASKWEDIKKAIEQIVRYEFYKDERLHDGLDDAVQRPNVFIAYYVYPELFTNTEWKKIFDSALGALWLEWGGLSTIDKDHELFQPEYTGSDNRSYHRGDSWYWINNLAAVCMSRLAPKYYKEKIDKIFKASISEILYSGAVSHHAEVSAAFAPGSRGCLAQAWSAALFIELYQELHISKRSLVFQKVLR